MSRCRRRLCLVLAAQPALLLALCGTAAAHVTVSPDTAAAGSETAFTFRVPAEKAHASTVKVVLALPASAPIPVVSAQVVPGWRAQLTTRRLPKPVDTDDGPVTSAVSRITWTCVSRASAIPPGQFQQFTISAGPLPAGGRLVFKVLQFYSDASVVRWIDPPTGTGELDHPAPTVTLRPTGAADGHSTSARAAGPGESGASWIEVAAFIAALAGLAAGAAALVLAVRLLRSGRTGRS